MKATIIKEFKLLLRDPGGLFLLLLMPAVLIIVMALVQDAPFKDYQNIQFKVVLSNNDKGTVGKKIKEALSASQQIAIYDTFEGKTVNDTSLQFLINKGTFQIGIIIPESSTKIVVNAANTISGYFTAIATSEPQEIDTSTAIHLVYDPMIKPSLKNSLNNMMQQIILAAKMDILMQRIASQSNIEGGISLDAMNVLNVKEYANSVSEIQAGSTNSVQHNVPAWAIFGIFMIVVPISSSIIKEREDGSALRIKLIPYAFQRVLFGKILFNIMVCLFQFLFMLLVGLYILPLFDLPQLYLGTYWWWLFPMILSIAFVAVSYGFLVGNLFKTSNQAMSFGSISVVMLSAIGGIWVPLEIMPNVMKQVAKASPLHWALEGINAIIIRNGNGSNIIIPIIVLLSIGLIFTTIAIRARQDVKSM